MPKFQVLLIADSRGKELAHTIPRALQDDGINDFEIFIKYYPGATIHIALNRALKYINEIKYNLPNPTVEPFDLIYLSVGVNNLTDKEVTYRLNPTNNKMVKIIKVKPAFDSSEDIQQHLDTELQIAKTTLQQFSKKIVLCHLIGLSISLWNKAGDIHTKGQDDINTAIPTINRSIDKWNANDGVISPFMTELVHKTRHGRMGHRYVTCLRDGVHYSQTLINKITRNFVRTLLHNIHATAN